MLMHAHNEPDGWDFPLGVTSQRYLIHFASPMSSQTGTTCGRTATSITYTAVIAAGLATSKDDAPMPSHRVSYLLVLRSHQPTLESTLCSGSAVGSVISTSVRFDLFVGRPPRFLAPSKKCAYPVKVIGGKVERQQGEKNLPRRGQNLRRLRIFPLFAVVCGLGFLGAAAGGAGGIL